MIKLALHKRTVVHCPRVRCINTNLFRTFSHDSHTDNNLITFSVFTDGEVTTHLINSSLTLLRMILVLTMYANRKMWKAHTASINIKFLD